MKTIIDLCNRSENAKDMALWNAHGALHNPNGIITYMNVPQGVMKAVL